MTLIELLKEKKNNGLGVEKPLIDFYLSLGNEAKIKEKMELINTVGFERLNDDTVTIKDKDAVRIYDENESEFEEYCEDEYGSLTNFIENRIPHLEFNSLNEIKIYTVWKLYEIFTSDILYRYKNHRLYDFLKERQSKDITLLEREVINYYLDSFSDDSKRLSKMKEVNLYGSSKINRFQSDLSSIDFLCSYRDDIEKLVTEEYESISTAVNQKLEKDESVKALPGFAKYRKILADFGRMAFAKVSNDLFNQISNFTE